MKWLEPVKSKDPYPLGVALCSDVKGGHVLHVAFLMPECRECGIMLQKAGGETKRIVLPGEFAFGRIMSAELPFSGDEAFVRKNLRYLFFADDRVFPDPFARVFPVHRDWGKPLSEEELFAGVGSGGDFSWEGDVRPRIPREESLLYGIHVRGFTKAGGPGVKHRGSFAGVREMLPYLRGLGVNGLVLMPVYTFLETEKEEEGRINYWGFKKAFYYAPNGTFAAGKDPETELKELVREAHLMGMELILQFYFPRSFRRGEILPVLQYYRIHYHADGFRLLGEELPMLTLCEDPLLTDCKLICEDFPYSSLQTGSAHLFSAGRNFSRIMRCFVKGDEGMLQPAIEAMGRQDNGHGRINYLSDYDGMRLLDLYSYERKHNEANGEDNRDGTDYNYSWNCGAEGPTRKKSILTLRRRLIKNALCLLFLSKGVPYLFMGDEAGSSQSGNNNPYCQDNEVSWVTWRSSALRTCLHEFTKTLIGLRKQYPCLTKAPFSMGREGKRSGYPELSYHGEEAFRPDLMSYSRQAGIYFNGSFYGCGDLYLALNMHWLPHSFALPGEDFNVLLETDEEKGCRIECREKKAYLEVPERTICILGRENKEKG